MPALVQKLSIDLIAEGGFDAGLVRAVAHEASHITPVMVSTGQQRSSSPLRCGAPLSSSAAAPAEPTSSWSASRSCRATSASARSTHAARTPSMAFLLRCTPAKASALCQTGCFRQARSKGKAILRAAPQRKLRCPDLPREMTAEVSDTERCTA